MSNTKGLIAKAKRAPKKNLAMGVGCVGGVIALIVWMVTWFI